MHDSLTKPVATWLARIRESLVEAMFNAPERPPFSVNGRLVFFGLVIFCGLGVLLAKLYYEQVVRHEYWAGRISKGSQVWDPLESTCRHASLSIL